MKDIIPTVHAGNVGNFLGGRALGAEGLRMLGLDAGVRVAFGEVNDFHILLRASHGIYDDDLRI